MWPVPTRIPRCLRNRRNGSAKVTHDEKEHVGLGRAVVDLKRITTQRPSQRPCVFVVHAATRDVVLQHRPQPPQERRPGASRHPAPCASAAPWPAASVPAQHRAHWSTETLMTNGDGIEPATPGASICVSTRR
jgi:hypothetical protein